MVGNFRTSLRIIRVAQQIRHTSRLIEPEDVMEGTIEVIGSGLDAAIEGRPRLTRVDFWAPRCAPCPAVVPVLGEVRSMQETDVSAMRAVSR